jgi:hypothetical protein
MNDVLVAIKSQEEFARQLAQRVLFEYRICANLTMAEFENTTPGQKQKRGGLVQKILFFLIKAHELEQAETFAQECISDESLEERIQNKVQCFLDIAQDNSANRFIKLAFSETPQEFSRLLV